jgi:hypothetical protein
MSALGRISNASENEVADTAWKKAGRVFTALANLGLTIVGAGSAWTGDLPLPGIGTYHTDSDFMQLGMGVATVLQARDTVRSFRNIAKP